MARALGKSVTVCDSVLDGVPQGSVHTILLDDSEEVPVSAEAVKALLAATAVEDAKVAAVLDAAPVSKGADPVPDLIAQLDALKADTTTKDWQTQRLAAVATASLDAGASAEDIAP